MPSSKEIKIDRRDFLKGTACFPFFGRRCFLGRDSLDLTLDASMMVVGGGIGAGFAAKFHLPKSHKRSRREFLKIIGTGALGGAVYGLAVGEFSNWWDRRQEVEEFLNGLPSPPEENKEIAELSLSELADLVNRLEGRLPTLEETDILLTATAYQAAQFLEESPTKAREYGRRVFKIFDEEEFRAFCSIKNAVVCTGEFSGGKLLAGFDFSKERLEQLFASEMGILDLVQSTAHEVAHMNVSRLEVFLHPCSRPVEDYGVLGRFEVVKRRGFFQNVSEPEGENLIDDGRLEEEFFAEWASYRFLNELERAGLEKKPLELLLHPKLYQAIINLEYTRPGANWPKWWQGAMDFDRVAKLHWENDLWRFRRDLGEVMLNHSQEFIPSPPKLSEGNKAALGKLAFEAFIEIKGEDRTRFDRLLQISSPEELLDL